MKAFSLPARQRLGEILVRHGICESAAVHDACGTARDSNRRLGAVLVEAGHLSENELVAALAEQYDARPLFSLSGHMLSPEVRNILPLETALLHKTLLFDLTEHSMGTGETAGSSSCPGTPISFSTAPSGYWTATSSKKGMNRC